MDVHPTLTDKAKLVQRNARIRNKGESGLPRPFSGRRSRRSVRSGYAFAHSEGFGRLITSGRIMRDVGGTMGGGRAKVHNGLPVPRSVYIVVSIVTTLDTICAAVQQRCAGIPVSQVV